MVKILWFQCRGHMFDPWSRNSDPTSCAVQPETTTTTHKVPKIKQTEFYFFLNRRPSAFRRLGRQKLGVEETFQRAPSGEFICVAVVCCRSGFCLFILAVLSLHRCTGFSPVAASEGCSLLVVCRLLTESAALVAGHGL